MFKKFSVEENVSSSSQLKNSVQRSIQAQIVESYPCMAEVIDEIIPKKQMTSYKCDDYIQLIVVNQEVLFYNQRDSPFYPTLKLLHKYPAMMQRMQVDKGAVRFILSGANIMCPGFTSAGGDLPVEIEAEKPVAIYVEGKEHAVGIGLTKMSTSDIKSINKGIAVESVHFIGDCLWDIKSIDQ